MSLSTAVYQIQQRIKSSDLKLTRSQIYELVASYYGFKSYKLFRQKAICIIGRFPTLSSNKVSFEKRCLKLNLISTDEIFKIIQTELVENNVCIIRVEDFYHLTEEIFGLSFDSQMLKIHREESFSLYDDEEMETYWEEDFDSFDYEMQEIDWRDFVDTNDGFDIKKNSLYQALTKARDNEKNSNTQLLLCKLDLLILKKIENNQILTDESHRGKDGKAIYDRWKSGEDISPFQDLLDDYIQMRESLNFLETELQNTIDVLLKLDFEKTVRRLLPIFSTEVIYNVDDLIREDSKDYNSYLGLDYHLRCIFKFTKALGLLGFEVESHKIHQAIINPDNLQINQYINQTIQDLDDQYQYSYGDTKEKLAIQIYGWLKFANLINLDISELKKYLSTEIMPHTEAVNSQGEMITENWEFGSDWHIAEYGGHEEIMALSEEGECKANEFALREFHIYSSNR